MKAPHHRRKARFLVLWVQLPMTVVMATVTSIVGHPMPRRLTVPLADLTARVRMPARTEARHISINTAATTHMLMAHMDNSAQAS